MVSLVSSTRSLVTSDVGEPAGITLISAAVPSCDTWGTPTAWTPSVAERPSCSLRSRGSSGPVAGSEPRSAVTISGALAPAPNASVRSSYAWRELVDSGAFDWSVRPSPRFSTGALSAIREARTPRRTCRGGATTADPSAARIALCPSVGRRSRPIRSRSIPSPHRASRAGSSVIDASTATTTTIAAAWPSTVMKDNPETASASRAMTTVPPANATALPEVAAAWPIASWTLRPSKRAERARVTMNSAVVDADAEADHRRDGRRHVRDRDEVPEQRDDAQAGR